MGDSWGNEVARHGWALGRKGTLALLVLAAAVLVPAEGANGICVGPELRVRAGGDGTPEVRAGETLTVEGVCFMEGCDDTGDSTGFGCSAGERGATTPRRDVTLVLRQGQREWRLGQEDARSADEGPPGRITWRATVPEHLRPGPARLVADGAEQPVVVATPLPTP
ncbi:hypothetical protein [Streptomyces sp. GC420]|uniref:hypothetical protein n=1 Tax=Streptomyces sp. GC420 TaxID=2697568 RepID=UPI00141523A5|nr:hypothetical protein [Streptomyces sp. GC420]NBM16452.1 hypothetical protein [Streptomyces sp. GC420]